MKYPAKITDKLTSELNIIHETILSINPKNQIEEIELNLQTYKDATLKLFDEPYHKYMNKLENETLNPTQLIELLKALKTLLEFVAIETIGISLLSRFSDISKFLITTNIVGKLDDTQISASKAIKLIRKLLIYEG